MTMVCLRPFPTRRSASHVTLSCRASITRVYTNFSSYNYTTHTSLAIPRLRTPCHAACTPRALKTSSASHSSPFLSSPPPCKQIEIRSYATAPNSGYNHQGSLNEMTSVPNTPAEIIKQLPANFEKAKEAGDVLFFPSTIHKHSEFGVEVCESVFFSPFPRIRLLNTDMSISLTVGDHAMPCIAEQA